MTRLITRTGWYQLAYNLRSAYNTIGDGFESITVPWRNERENILRHGIETFPKSQYLVNDYFDLRLKLIAEYESAFPDLAVAMYHDAVEQINVVIGQVEAKSAILPLRVKIEKKEQNFKRQLARRNLVGKPAPQLDNLHWLQNDSKRASQNDISTILFFFKYGSAAGMKNLDALNHHIAAGRIKANLVAIVPDFGLEFSWLSSFERKRNASSDQVNEFRSRIKSVVQENGYGFPFALTTAPVEMADAFGITEIPHAVIISHNRKVESVFLGKDVAELIIGELQ